VVGVRELMIVETVLPEDVEEEPHQTIVELIKVVLVAVIV
jgi:hypothetical protein